MEKTNKAIRRILSVAAILIAAPATAQQLRLSVRPGSNDTTMAAAMRRLARQVIAGYSDAERDRYLDNLGRLQIAAGEFSLADLTFDSLRGERLSANNPKAAVGVIPLEIFARAKSLTGRTFPTAFSESYREVAATISDSAAAYELVWAFGTSVTILERNFRDALARLQGSDSISQSQAIDLIRRYVALNAYSAQAPFLSKAQDDDDRRRYLVDKDVLVRTPEGASICVLVMRPRTGSRLTALLNFSIYADQNHIDEARLSASRGYAGVSALSRGKGCSPDSPMPFEHDGVDAAAVIDWIAGQSWSDGRVGMFGGSYDGFAQWAAANHHPKALKAMMPSVAADPGLGFPMEGGVFMNYSYPYPFYVTDGKGLDDATYFDSDRWNRLNATWYASGRAYAALDSLDGTPNPIFDNWLAHPGYDEYWKAMMPYGEDFAGITIPILTTTGYYDSGQEGALHFFNEHVAHDRSAEHYLVIGPYDHVRGQRGTISPLGTRLSVLRGYSIDSAAQIEIPGLLRYQWFDYVFKGGPKPVLLKDKVNYEVMGANVWKHAPTVAAMAPDILDAYLTSERSGTGYKLSERKPDKASVIPQQIDLADRGDVRPDDIDQALDDWPIIDKAPHIANAVEFVSEPLPDGIEVSGLFTGHLDFLTNKRDFDFDVTLFELTAKGEYFQLSYYWSRASYVGDRGRRQLLVPGKPQRLDFVSRRLTSKRLGAGSRLVVVLSIIKQPGEQINYGTGRDVSTETIADAKIPLRINWLNSCVIRMPVVR